MIERFLPPGTYEICWTLPSTSGKTYRAPGEVHLFAHQQPFGRIKGGQFPDWLAAERNGLMSRFDLPHLTGHLPSGHVVHFRDVQLDAILDSSRLHPSIALVGISDLDPSQDTIDSLLIQVSGVNEVFALGPPAPAVVEKSKGVTVRVISEKDAPPGTEREARAISFTFDAAVPLRDVISGYVESFRRIVSIGVGRSAAVTALSVGVTPTSYIGDAEWFDVFGLGVGQEIERMDPVWPGDTPALIFSSVDAPLMDMISTWEVLESTQHPLVDLFGASIYYRDSHPRSRFLIAVQTLEGGYAVDNQSSLSTAQVKYRAKRDAAIKEIAKRAASQLPFIDGALPKREPRALDDALRSYCGAFLAEVEAPLRTVTSVADLIHSLDAKDAIDGVRLIRNHLSHGEKSYPSDDLHQIARVLEGAIRRKVLEKLGASAAAQQRATKP